jgi:hypothetical protein
VKEEECNSASYSGRCMAFGPKEAREVLAGPLRAKNLGALA